MNAIFAVLVMLSSPAFADTISGNPRVTDGDTFRYESGIKIRLFGVDTPEKNQRCERNDACYPCGEDATRFVQSFIGKKELSCDLTGDKTYDRFVAVCSVGGKDLGEAIIAAGWGTPYRQFLKGHRFESRYETAEKAARDKKLGMHRGRFIPPSEWRGKKMRLECERG